MNILRDIIDGLKAKDYVMVLIIVVLLFAYFSRSDEQETSELCRADNQALQKQIADLHVYYRAREDTMRAGTDKFKSKVLAEANMLNDELRAKIDDLQKTKETDKKYVKRVSNMQQKNVKLAQEIENSIKTEE